MAKRVKKEQEEQEQEELELPEVPKAELAGGLLDHFTWAKAIDLVLHGPEIMEHLQAIWEIIKKPAPAMAGHDDHCPEHIAIMAESIQLHTAGLMKGYQCLAHCCQHHHDHGE